MKQKQVISVTLGCLAVILVSLHITFFYRATAPVMEANGINDMIGSDILIYSENVLVRSMCIDKKKYDNYGVKLTLNFLDSTSYKFIAGSVKCSELSSLLGSGERQKIEIYKIVSGWYITPILVRVNGIDIVTFENVKGGLILARRLMIYMILGCFMGMTFWFFAKKHREKMNEMIKQSRGTQ